jgi:hypothetical protein
MEKLSLIRQQEEISRQAMTQSKQLFDQAMAAFVNKQYGPAIELFQQSFHLNPNNEETQRYLKLAQQEEQRIRAERAATIARAKAGLPAVPTTTRPPTSTQPGVQPKGPTGTTTTTHAAADPAQFTTFFNSPVNDGYIMVKVGADVVAHENLYEERGRAIFRRRAARVVNVAASIPPKSADVEVWVVIPSQQINEHHTMRGNFAPGTQHRLVVTFDPRTKQFNYQLN